MILGHENFSQKADMPQHISNFLLTLPSWKGFYGHPLNIEIFLNAQISFACIAENRDHILVWT
jgi:hypothetical protein